MYIWGFPEPMPPWKNTGRLLRLVCHLELGRKESSGLDLKENVGNLQIAGMEHAFGKQLLAGPPVNNGIQRGVKQILLGSSLSATLSVHVGKVIVLFPSTGFSI